LSSHATAISEAVGNAISQIAQGAKTAERRGQLLWWRQALYSPTLKQGYRQMEPAVATLLMGYDLHKQIADYYPQSMEYLLREAVNSVRTSDVAIAPDGLTVFDFCRQLQSSERSAELRQELKASIASEPGRIPLLSVVKNALAGEPLDAEKLMGHVGVKSDTKVDLEDLAVWMLRDFQAHRLAIQKQ